jgi:hypothetical protein
MDMTKSGTATQECVSNQTRGTFLTPFLCVSVLKDQEHTLARLQQQTEQDSQRAKDGLAQLRRFREQVSAPRHMKTYWYFNNIRTPDSTYANMIQDIFFFKSGDHCCM